MTLSPSYRRESVPCLVRPTFFTSHPYVNGGRLQTGHPAKVARNLFGKPDPNDIAQLSRISNEENALHMMKCYNVDIRNKSQVNNSPSIYDDVVDDGSSAKKSTNSGVENLIELETQQYEQLKRNLTADKLQQTAEITPKSKIIISTHKNKRNNCSVGGNVIKSTIPTLSPGSGNERQKPYERQTLITEYHAVCKELKRAPPTLKDASKLTAVRAVVLNTRTQIETNALNEEEETSSTVVSSTSDVEAISTSSTAVTLTTAQDVKSTSSAIITTSTTKTVATTKTASQL